LKKFLSKAGLVVYEATANDTVKLGGAGICDHCNTYSQTGFLIAILSSYVCKSCYDEWNARSKKYSEDQPMEERKVIYFDSVFQIHEIDAAMSELKEKVRQRDSMGGDLWWNVLNGECCIIANKCGQLGGDYQEIASILGEGTFI
jgi:hypothetical protein